MATTSVSTSSNLRKQAWEEKLFRDTMKESYFTRFMNESSESVVQVKTQLEKSKGDKITFGLIPRLSGAGVTGTQPLEGNEEALTTYDYDVVLELYRHGVKTNGTLDEKRPVWDMPEEARSALKVWGAEKIDQLCFDALQASPTKIFYLDSSGNMAAGTVAATVAAALDATNSKVDDLSYISALKTWAQTGGSRTQTPLRPVKVDGKEYFILLLHPDVLYDIKTCSEYEQANREARERSLENPLFRGSDFVWDGVIVHSHENVFKATNGGGGSVAYAKNLFLGAQALTWAWGKRPYTVERDFDYGEKKGFSWNMMAGVEKPVFNSKDYGVLNFFTSRTNVSGL